MAEERRLNIFGEIDLGTYSHVVNALSYLQLKDPKQPIDIIMNTRGGSVVDGLAMYDVIKKVSEKTPVHITASGACMSMGTIILQAASKRYAHPHAEFLLHEIQYASSGSHSANTEQSETAKRLQNVLFDILASKMKISRKEIDRLTFRSNYTFPATEALKIGLIDKIL